MRFDIVSIFPGMFESPLSDSILQRAKTRGLLEVFFHDPRDFTKDKHRSVDDKPYGGGSGMVMRVEPMVEAIESIPRSQKSLCVMLSASGEPFVQSMARDFSTYEQIILVCGRYEGIDERVRELVVDRSISVGDAVLTGGELPALMVIDAVTRLLPGVLGNESSLMSESFEEGLLEYPQYTRPPVFRDLKVPEVLMSGNHADIEAWRKEQSLQRTEQFRPDLWKKGKRV